MLFRPGPHRFENDPVAEHQGPQRLRWETFDVELARRSVFTLRGPG